MVTTLEDIPGKYLAAAIKAVVPSAGRGDTTPVLCAVQFSVSAGELVLSATDGFTLSRDVVGDTFHQTGDDVWFMLSVADAKRVAALVRSDKYKGAKLVVNAGGIPSVSVSLFDSALTARTVEGTRPRLESVLDKLPDGSAPAFGMVQLNGDYLARFATRNLARDQHESRQGVRFTMPVKASGGVVGVAFSDHFTGALMSQRIPEEHMPNVSESVAVAGV